MQTNVQIIQKEIDTFNNGNTTRCIILAKIDLPEDLIHLVEMLPGFYKFVNAQTRIYWYESGRIEVEGMGYVYKHKDDAMNPKLGEHFAITKAQANVFKLAKNFQENLKKFIIKSFCSDLNSGIDSCDYAKNNCLEHIQNLKKLCLTSKKNVK